MFIQIIYSSLYTQFCFLKKLKINTTTPQTKKTKWNNTQKEINNTVTQEKHTQQQQQQQQKNPKPKPQMWSLFYFG